jgi:hypothetical protein
VKLFFGILQFIYVLFSSSTRRWKVFLDHIPSLTMTGLSNIGWESRIKSVKAVRYQAPQLRLAFFEAGKIHTDAKSKTDAKNILMLLVVLSLYLVCSSGMTFYLL